MSNNHIIKNTIRSILIISFEPIEGSEQCDTIIYYYDAVTGSGGIVDLVFILHDALSRLRYELSDIDDPDNLMIVKRADGEHVVTYDNDEIMIMGVETSYIIKQV